MVNMKYVHEILHYVLVYTIRMNSQDARFTSAAGILF